MENSLRIDVAHTFQTNPKDDLLIRPHLQMNSGAVIADKFCKHCEKKVNQFQIQLLDGK